MVILEGIKIVNYIFNKNYLDQLVILNNVWN